MIVDILILRLDKIKIGLPSERQADFQCVNNTRAAYSLWSECLECHHQLFCLHRFIVNNYAAKYKGGKLTYARMRGFFLKIIIFVTLHMQYPPSHLLEQFPFRLAGSVVAHTFTFEVKFPQDVDDFLCFAERVMAGSTAVFA